MEMKFEINNKNKAKFFALYWDQLIGLGLNDQLDINKSKFKSQSAFTEMIELKPLSSIGDEDAIEVANLNECSNKNSLEFKLGLGKSLCNPNHVLYRISNFSQNEIDFLRMCGYALPWMGLSVEEMVEAGWIKLTT